MKTVTQFPVNSWQRTQNRRGPGSVSSIIHERWLQFSKASEDQMPIGTPIEVEVMTAENGAERRICSMTVTVEQLERMLEYVKSK